MSMKKWRCHNLDPETGKRKPDRPDCKAEVCPGIHPEEPRWASGLVYNKLYDPARRTHRPYEHDRDKARKRPGPRTEPASIVHGRDPPILSSSARVSRDETNSTSSGPTSRPPLTNQPHDTNRVRSSSTANKAAVGWGSSSHKNSGWGSPPNNARSGSPVDGKNRSWGADGGGWGSPVRDDADGWGSPVANDSGRNADWGSTANNSTTLRAPQPPVAKSKPVPATAEPFDKATTKPASFPPSKSSFSASSSSRTNTSNLMDVTRMPAPSSTPVRRSSQSTPAPTPRERSASLAIALPHEFISPSPAPSLPPKPRPSSLRLENRPSHSRRESLQTSPATETGPPSSVSAHSNYSAFAVPLVSASPRTIGFGCDSPVSAISASTIGGGLRILATPEGTHVQAGAKQAAKDPADVLWNENTEAVCLALIRRRELQAVMEQVKRRDQFYSTMRARHSSCTLPPSFNSPNDPLNQRVQEAQKGYEEVLTDLSERKTSWWPTPTFVDPSNVLVDLEKGLVELEREIEEVMGMTVRSRAEGLAAAPTKDSGMDLVEPEERLDTASKATPVRLTSADVAHALEDLENRVEEVEEDIDAHLESVLRRKVRAYLRKRFPPAPRPAATDRLETTLLRAKQAGTRVQGLENRLAGLTMISNADQIELVRERVKKRREETQELSKKEESILEFLSIHNASLDVPKDKLKEILKQLTAENGLISDIAKPYCDHIQATIDSLGTATIPEDRQATLRKSRRDRASDEIYELVAGAPQMQQQLTMADWVRRNWGHIKRGEPPGMGPQSMGMDIVMR